MEDKEIGNYKIIKEIGQGSFGTVYEVLDTRSHKRVAMKLEEKAFDKSQLENEYNVYMDLKGQNHIPEIYYYGIQNGCYYITMKILGPSLAHIHKTRKKFTLKTVCMIGKRMVQVLETIHSKDYIYRDMKPDNIMTKGRDIYLIDFGMCKKYVHRGKHIPMVDTKVLTGTARYASINTHKGYEQGRRDDLEGLFYVLVFLMQGELPWMGIPAPTRKEKYAKIGEIKENTTAYNLCKELQGCDYFIKYISYVRTLRFEQKPDYKFLINIFTDLMKRHKLKDDEIYDWIEIKEEKEKDKSKEKPSGVWHNIKSFFDSE